MTTIKATCPHCGEITLTPPDIDLRVDASGAQGSSYAFACPSCEGYVRKPADERIVRLLISGGVEVLEPEAEPEPRFDGPALTYDDLLDFHALLADDAWLDALLAESHDGE